MLTFLRCLTWIENFFVIELTSYRLNYILLYYTNNVIKLSSFKGKYVLIDFWATWCIPCRLEIPKLIKAKQLLASDNFEIISVSLDDKSSRQKWLDAIKNEKMDWVNLSTLDGFSNVIARKYHIKYIPSSFLIDPNGKILAKNVSGENLYQVVRNHLISDVKKNEKAEVAR